VFSVSVFVQNHTLIITLISSPPENVMTRRGLHVWDRIVFTVQLMAIAGMSVFSIFFLNSQAAQWALAILLPGLVYLGFRLKRSSITEPLRSLSARTAAFCDTASGLANLSDAFFRRLTQFSDGNQNLAIGLEASLENCRHLASSHWDLLQKVQELEVLVGKIQDSGNRMDPLPFSRNTETFGLSRFHHPPSGLGNSGLTTSSRSVHQWANDLSQVRKEIHDSIRDLQQRTGRVQETHLQLSNAARQNSRRAETLVSEASQILSKAEQSAAIFREVNFVLQDVVERGHRSGRTHSLQQPHPILETHLTAARLASGELDSAELVEIR
jgi:hypothetical protein